MEGFERRDGFVLIHVRRRISQRFGPIAREHRGILFRPGLGGRDHHARGPAQRLDGTAARAGHVHHELARGGHVVEQRRQLRPRNVGSGNVELVIHAIEGAMADQHHHQRIRGLRLFRELRESRANLVARGRRERHHVGIAARALQTRVDIVGPHLEPLFVIRLAAQPGDGHIKGGGGRRERGQQQQREQPHTTPHLLRNSHSLARSARASRKMAGISHRSRVSRVEMPASEYEISFASLDASPGL